MKYIKIGLVSLTLLYSGISFAGELIKNASVVSVNNISNNEDMFTVWISDGTGPCANTGYIKFPLSESVSAEAHARAYSAALTALTTGMSIEVHN